MRSGWKELRVKYLHGRYLSQGVLSITRCQTQQSLGTEAWKLQSVASNTASPHGMGGQNRSAGGENGLKEGWVTEGGVRAVLTWSLRNSAAGRSESECQGKEVTLKAVYAL